MKLKIECKSNSELIPFSYQYELASCVHKWLGENNAEHGNMAFFSFSGFAGGEAVEHGIKFKQATTWSFSAIDNRLLAKVVEGIQKDPRLFRGFEVSKVMMQEEPEFTNQMRFYAASPVLLKKTEEKGRVKYLIFSDLESAESLTANMCHKLDVYGKPEWKENLNIKFDEQYPGAKTKLIDIKGIKNRGSVCPVIISGMPEAIRFAWHVGVGSSNGMGFGFLN